MRILYVSQYFPPETAAPAVRVHELSREWVKLGHKVTVLTGFPNHPTGILHSDYRKKFRRMTTRETVDGIDVVRSWLVPLPNRKALERIVNYSSFCFSAALRGLFLKKFDVVVATSPQLLVGLSGLAISRLRGSKFIFEVRDLWPESLVGTGVADTSSLVYRSLLKVSSRLYRSCDHVVAVTPAFKDHIQKHFDCPAEKISVVPNGVDLDFFEQARLNYVPSRNGRFVVSFIGTIGNAHGVDVILAAARALRESHPAVLFRIVGEGAERERIESEIKKAQFDNIEVLGHQPRARIPSLIWDSDVCLVLLKRSDVFRTVIPTKMLEFMAAGRPVILGVEGQALEILALARAGIGIPPESSEGLVSAVLKLMSEPSLCRLYGENGKSYIHENMSRKSTAVAYENVLLRLVGDGAVEQETINHTVSAGSNS